MNPANPKISVITPSFNQGIYIKDNIESVLYQDNPDYEHIIIDFGSTDNTLGILSQYKHIKWLSEKDNGPVDAIIKGINMAKGDIITWLNSDDYYPPNIFNKIIEQFRTNDIQILVGNLMLVKPDKEFIYQSNHKNIYNLDYLIRYSADIITQPSTFFTKRVYMQSGGFDRSLKLVWDYDLFVKMFKLHKPFFVDKVLAVQRLYDNTLSRKFARKQAIELFKVSRKHGAKYSDPINWKLLKRFLIPDTVKINPGFLVKTYRSIKSKNNIFE
jgi:glycosyltransferase involved in cell wall biosynthesis